MGGVCHAALDWGGYQCGKGLSHCGYQCRKGKSRSVLDRPGVGTSAERVSNTLC